MKYLSFKISIFSLLFFSILSLTAQEEKEDEEPEVLIFYKTEGYWHRSIPTGRDVIEELGENNGFDVSDTDEAEDFNKEDLQEYDLVIFLNTTGNVLNEKQQEAFEYYMENGGNFLGIHAAADTEYDWPWYGKLVGARFMSHPEVTQAEVVVEKPNNPMVWGLPKRWKRTDEWYNYRDIQPGLKVIMTVDESTYEGGKNGTPHPIAWYHDMKGGGVAIYTGGGHTIESYWEPAFRQHLLQCILFALGEKNDNI